MPPRSSPLRSPFSSPVMQPSPTMENVFYIPIPPTGEIVFHSLTREQKHLLERMGKPSPEILDKTPATPQRRSPGSPGRHNLRPSPAPSASEDSANPAYMVSPRVQESMERIRLHKETLAAMRAGRSPSGISASASPPEGSRANSEAAIRFPPGTSACAGNLWVENSGGASYAGCKATKTAESGTWEPLIEDPSPQGHSTLLGLGISVWTESTGTRRKLFENSTPEQVATVSDAAASDIRCAEEVSILPTGQGADLVADDAGQVLEMASPTTSIANSHDVLPTPEVGSDSSLGPFKLLSGRGFCCTGPVSRSILLLAWGWRSAGLAHQEEGSNYLERGIERARRSLEPGRE